MKIICTFLWCFAFFSNLGAAERNYIGPQEAFELHLDEDWELVDQEEDSLFFMTVEDDEIFLEVVLEKELEPSESLDLLFSQIEEFASGKNISIPMMDFREDDEEDDEISLLHLGFEELAKSTLNGLDLIKVKSLQAEMAQLMVGSEVMNALWYFIDVDYFFIVENRLYRIGLRAPLYYAMKYEAILDEVVTQLNSREKE